LGVEPGGEKPVPAPVDPPKKPYALRDLLRDLQAHRALGVEGVLVVVRGRPHRIVATFRDGADEESVCLVVE
jgi:hypothetical protein